MFLFLISVVQMLPIERILSFQRQDWHVLSGFSLSHYPMSILDFMENQFYLGTKRNMKTKKLPTIWISIQDETQIRI